VQARTSDALVTRQFLNQHYRLTPSAVAGDALVRRNLADAISAVGTVLPAFVVNCQKISHLVIQLTVHPVSDYRHGIQEIECLIELPSHSATSNSVALNLSLSEHRAFDWASGTQLPSRQTDYCQSMFQS